MTSSNTAILIFTNDLETESKRKCFSVREKANREITKEFIQSTINKVQATSLPHFTITTKQQNGSKFGERLSNAIESIFSNGFNNIIVIGNDCPNLNSKLLLKTEELLQTNQIVVGPTINGGSYLIGLSKHSFDKTAFENLSWETKELLNDLIRYSKINSNHFYITEYFYDINNRSDIKYFIDRQSYNSTLAKLISHFITEFILFHTYYKFQFSLSPLRFLFGLVAPPKM